MKSHGKNTKVRFLADPAALAAFWRRLYPVKTADCVADMLGAPKTTVESWLAGPSLPSTAWWFRIVDVWGPAVMVEAHVAPPAWLIALARAQTVADLEAQQRDLDARIAGLRGRRCDNF